MVRSALYLCLPLSLLLATAPVAASEAGVVSVDYVIGMVKAGLDQDAIIEHILKNKLTFRLSEGSLGRLREAGAGGDLVRVVGERTARSGEGWERPRRLGEYGDIWSGSGEDEADQEDGGGAGSYGGYAFYSPWYGYYPGIYGSFLYDPFFTYYPYYPYYLPYGYHSFYFPRHHPPRLHDRFHGRVFSPRGDRIAPRGSPHAGRSPAGGRTRTAPRGSH